MNTDRKIFYSYHLIYRPDITVHDQILIGVLFVFVKDKRIRFFYPENVNQRVKEVFKDKDNYLIENLKHFAEKAESISDTFDYFLAENIDENFIPKNESSYGSLMSLFFANKGFGVYRTCEEIEKHFIKQYFKNYE